MTITASIVADSISQEGYRLTTFLLRYPRFVHSELMTHRVFSRNASSSRAIPVKKLIADIRKDPATFVFWGRNQKGMQASEELEGFPLWLVQTIWIWGMWVMTTLALLADKMGAHKQTVNRMVEPWSHITVVVSSTDYGNWFALRNHTDAMPEIEALAILMYAEYGFSTPVLLKPGQWHLPFIRMSIQDDGVQSYEDWDEDGEIVFSQFLTLEQAIKVSVARCARTSYKTHDNRRTTWEEDVKLFDRLVGQVPLHASPTEHQATPDDNKEVLVASVDSEGVQDSMPWRETRWENPDEHGNFSGWRQYRKTLHGENQADAPGTYSWMVEEHAQAAGN